jgi:hypothetical protein
MINCCNAFKMQIFSCLKCYVWRFRTSYLSDLISSHWWILTLMCDDASGFGVTDITRWQPLMGGIWKRLLLHVWSRCSVLTDSGPQTGSQFYGPVSVVTASQPRFASQLSLTRNRCNYKVVWTLCLQSSRGVGYAVRLLPGLHILVSSSATQRIWVRFCAGGHEVIFASLVFARYDVLYVTSVLRKASTEIYISENISSYGGFRVLYN